MNTIARTYPQPLSMPLTLVLLLAMGFAMNMTFLGCAANNANFKEAQAQYAVAAGDPKIVASAPVPMQKAQKNLDMAAKQHKDEDQSHFSYLVTKQVEIARAEADRKASESELVNQRAVRNQGLLDARTQEADNAHQQTHLARQDTLDAEARAFSSEMEAGEARTMVNEMSVRNHQLRQDLTDLQTRETNRGLEISLGGSYFKVQKSNLQKGAMLKLDSVVLAMRGYPNQEAIIEGHTDNTGTMTLNQKLSQERADSVANYLISQGIASSRIIARGYGESFPSMSNDTAAGRQQNRRVDIVLLNNGKKAEESLRE